MRRRKVPGAVGGVDDERRAEGHPDPITPTATSKLHTFDESIVRGFVMVPGPSDRLRPRIFDSDAERLDETPAFQGEQKYDLASAYSDSANPR